MKKATYFFEGKKIRVVFKANNCLCGFYSANYFFQTRSKLFLVNHLLKV